MGSLAWWMDLTAEIREREEQLTSLDYRKGYEDGTRDANIDPGTGAAALTRDEEIVRLRAEASHAAERALLAERGLDSMNLAREAERISLYRAVRCFFGKGTKAAKWEVLDETLDPYVMEAFADKNKPRGT